MTRPVRRMLVLGTLAALAACAPGGAGNGCDWVRPIYVGKEDVLTADTARQILAHDRSGATLCGWQAK